MREKFIGALPIGMTIMTVGNSRYLTIGPGGRKCNCCFPAPGSKDRRSQFRIAKRRAKREAMKQACADISDAEALALELKQELEEFYDDFGTNWEGYDDPMQEPEPLDDEPSCSDDYEWDSWYD